MIDNILICKLCKKKPANQTGSHIFSFFLIRGATNEKGEVKRDKEVLFAISPTNFINTYFGRSINPEIIEEIKGRELSFEEIEQNINPFVIDNLVCRDCEKRFGTVEIYFKDNVYDKLIANKLIDKTDNKGTTIKICDGIDSRMIRLFIYLQLWRAAAANYNDWKLKPKEEEELRMILDIHLGSMQGDTIELVKKSKIELSHFPLIVTFTETKEGKETENTIIIDRSKMPYCLIMNDIVVQFFIKERHVRGTINWVYGISDMIERKEHVNYKEDKFRIGYLKNSQREKFAENLAGHIAREFIQKTMGIFSLLFQKCFSRKPTIDIGEKVLEELINDDQPLGYKYTLDHVRKVFARNIWEIQEKTRRRR